MTRLTFVIGSDKVDLDGDVCFMDVRDEESLELLFDIDDPPRRIYRAFELGEIADAGVVFSHGPIGPIDGDVEEATYSNSDGTVKMVITNA